MKYRNDDPPEEFDLPDACGQCGKDLHDDTEDSDHPYFCSKECENAYCREQGEIGNQMYDEAMEQRKYEREYEKLYETLYG